MRLGAVLVLLALTAVAAVVTQVIVDGLPQVWLVVLAAMLVGTAAAWPIARRTPVTLPSCGECGYPSWASVELRFCIRCGSQRVWRMD